jgi:hypothetical protein
MSLKWFHILFVTTSVLLSWVAGAWCFLGPQAGNYKALGVFFVFLGAVLIVYGVMFWRKIKQVVK